MATPVRRLGQYVKARPDLKILIEGHWSNDKNSSKEKRYSRERALAVQRFLTQNYNIDKHRIKTVGYGSARPLTAEKNSEDKLRNRRVSVVGLTNLSQKSLTQNGYAANCTAYLALREGDVQTKAPWDVRFVNGRYQQQLFEGHKISVYNESRAAIRFIDGSLITMSENSRVTFNGGLDFGEEPNMEIEKGKIQIELRPMSTRKDFEISFPNGKLIFYGQSALLNVVNNEQDHSISLSLFEGNANVIYQGEKYSLQEGEGFKVSGNMKLKPSKLPNMPSPILPLDNQTVNKGEISFSWTSKTKENLLQLSKKRDFRSLVYSSVISDSRKTVKLKDGVYFWRVSGINKDGLAGTPSQTRRIIVPDEYVTMSTIDKNAKKIFKEGAKAKLATNISHDTTVHEKIIKVMGVVDPGSKVFINNTLLDDVSPKGSFSQKLRLIKGKNELRVDAHAQNGLENGKVVNIYYYPIVKIKFAMTFSPIIPITTTHYSLGLGGKLTMAYMLSKQLYWKISAGYNVYILEASANGFSNSSVKQVNRSILTDLGLVYETAARSAITPYVELNSGLFWLNRSAKVRSKQKNSVYFSSGVGGGVKFITEGQNISLGTCYRLILQGDDLIDKTADGTFAGLLEMQLTFWF